MAQKKLNFRLAVTATLMGNTLEWYDYQTYGLFVPIFIHIFFINIDPSLAVLQSLFIYAIGQIVRPLGGILFGFIADRWGRKISLIASILFMTGPVFIIAILPNHMQIGMAAPVIFAVMRGLQGIAAGGEMPVVATYLVESSPKKTRGLFGSLAFFGVFLGLFIGIVEFSVIHYNMPIETIYAWGWRIPFVVGVLIGCCIFYLRRKLSETPLYRETQSHGEGVKDPFLKILQKNKKAIGSLIGLTCMQTVSFNIMLICLTAHLTQYLKMSLATALALNVLLLIFLQLFTPMMGRAGDRWGHRKIAQWAAWGFLFLSYPLYRMIEQGNPISQVVGIFGFAGLIAGYHASMPVLFCDLFPTSIRASGIGLSYNLGAGFIGGLTPITVFYLTERFKVAGIAAFFLMGAAIISLIVLSKITKHRLYLTTET